MNKLFKLVLASFGNFLKAALVALLNPLNRYDLSLITSAAFSKIGFLFIIFIV